MQGSKMQDFRETKTGASSQTHLNFYKKTNLSCREKPHVLADVYAAYYEKQFYYFCKYNAIQAKDKNFRRKT